MTGTLDKLTFYLQAVIEKTGVAKYRSVSAALLPVLPQMIQAIADVIADPGTTAAQRIQCAEMLMSLWGRCRADEYREERVLTVKERAMAAKIAAKTQDRKHKLTVLAEQKRIDKLLQQAKQTGGNNGNG
jgi:hypothetical protein